MNKKIILSKKPSPYGEIFAKRLKALRKQKGFSQSGFAAILQLAQPTVSNYEKGTSIPGPAILVSICNTLETTTDYLLGQTDSPEIPDIQKSNILRRYELLAPKEREWLDSCIEMCCKKVGDNHV